MFLVYSKENCPYCYKIKTVLEMSNENFIEYKLDQDFTREEFYDKFGEGSTFPRVMFNGSMIGGCVDTIQFIKEQKM